MPERVIAMDPGHRTGWASATVAENSITDITHGVLPCKEMYLALARTQYIGRKDIVTDPPLNVADVLVYETWRPRPQDGSMNWIQGNPLIEVQLVGQIRGLGWLSGAKLVGYGPDRKDAFTASMPEPLRQRMAACHEQHDQDALMHLWGYALENWVTDPSNVTID